MGSRDVLAIPVSNEEVSEWIEPLDWHFRSFCGDGSLNPGDLWDDVACKRRQLWVAMAEKPLAAVLTTVRDDNYQTCVLTHAAGEDMRSWLHLWDKIEAWAKGIGCERIEAIARPGWERVLRDMKKTHVVLEKRL